MENDTSVQEQHSGWVYTNGEPSVTITRLWTHGTRTERLSEARVRLPL